MYGGYLDAFITSGSLWAPFAVTVVTTFLIRIHPEPADACCKCFEDGVAFAGVFIGVKVGQWRNPVLNTQAGIASRITPMAIVLLKSATMIVLGIAISRRCVNLFQEFLFFLRGELQRNPSSIEFYPHSIDCLKS